MITVLESRTYLPVDGADLTAVGELLTSDDASAFALVGPHGRVAVPAEVHAVLVQVVGAMTAGRAVTLTPRAQKLTTQQAADVLGMSRPTLVKLADDGSIPCERISNRRTLKLEDVLAYRSARQERQLAAIAATSTDIEDELDADQLRSLLREARAANARRRESSGH